MFTHLIISEPASNTQLDGSGQRYEEWLGVFWQKCFHTKIARPFDTNTQGENYGQLYSHMGQASVFVLIVLSTNCDKDS